MARPEAGAPPVAPSAVATVNPKREALPERAKYVQLVEAFNRPDRRADLRAMLGGDDTLVERFLAVVFHAVSTDNDLLRKATLPSLIQAVKDSAAMGLEPTGLLGEGWILVYGDQAQFAPGYRGYLKRIRNSGAVVHVTAEVVHMNDVFEWSKGSGGLVFKHDQKIIGEKDEAGNLIETRGDYRGAYAVVWFPGGVVDGQFMDVQEIWQDAQRFSPAVQRGKPSPWQTHWGEMAKKTVVRRLSKYLPQASVDLLLAADARADDLAKAEGGKALDTSKARSAVLAALGRGADAVQEGQEQPSEEVEGEAKEQPVEPAAEPAAEPQEPESMRGSIDPLNEEF